MNKRGLSITDEPQLVQPKKVQRTTGAVSVCGLSLSQWKELLFPYLELVELVQLQRTCRGLAGYPVLRQMIKNKRLAAFKGIRTESWNKFAPTNKSREQLVDLFRKHPGKFLVAQLFKGGFTGDKNTLAAFSSKHRMICAILDKVTPHRKISVQQHDGFHGICHDLICLGLTEDDIEQLVPPEPLPSLFDFL